MSHSRCRTYPPTYIPTYLDCLCKAIEQRMEIGTEGTDDAKSEYGGIVTIDEAPVSGVLFLVTGFEGFLKENVG
jgi:hypothetical protein